MKLSIHSNSSQGDSSATVNVATEGELERLFVGIENPAVNKRTMIFGTLSKCVPCKGGMKTFGSDAVAMVKRRLPIIEWLPKYDWKSDIFTDSAIGLSLGFIIAPKALGHALLANVNPMNGVYTAFFGATFYGFMGTSMWLSVGTGALPSIMFGDILKSVSDDPNEYSSIAPMLTFYIGMVTTLIAVVRLDKFMALVAPAVISGFTVAGAFLILASQLKYVAGVHISPPEIGAFVMTFVELFEHIREWNIPTLLLGLSSMAFLILSKMVCKRMPFPDPGALVLVLASTIISATMDLKGNYGVQTVGEQELGFPVPALPWSRLTDSSLHIKLFTNAITLAFVNFVLMISISKGMGLKSKTEINTRQEVIALATVNTVGSFFSTFIATASFSGSAIIASYNARSLLPNFINASVMLIIMTLLGHVIAPLPKVTLSSIIIVALPRLIEFKTPRELWSVKKEDSLLWILTFIITLFTSMQIGIYCGIGLSILMLAWRTVQTDGIEVGQLPNTTIYRSLRRFQDARQPSGMRLFRIDSSLNYANVDYVTSILTRLLDDCDEDTVAGTIVLSCEAVNNIDTAAILMLEKFGMACEKRGMTLLFSGFKASVRKTLCKAKRAYESKHPNENLPAILNPNIWFLNLHDSVCYCQQKFCVTKNTNFSDDEHVVLDLAAIGLNSGSNVQLTTKPEEEAEDK
mmetsp:Transcript_6840/g.10830  ORF Transcript_6840/g.10830 Transcript_6840/m.10830 type:complete len:690 (+) Transcript_6840:134-2203(+)